MQADFINLNSTKFNRSSKYHGDKKGDRVYLLNIILLLSYLQY